MIPFSTPECEQSILWMGPVLNLPSLEARYADSTPQGVCDRCGSSERREVSIHDGQSIRRDCGNCGRFLGWVKWYGAEAAK